MRSSGALPPPFWFLNPKPTSRVYVRPFSGKVMSVWSTPQRSLNAIPSQAAGASWAAAPHCSRRLIAQTLALSALISQQQQPKQLRRRPFLHSPAAVGAGSRVDTKCFKLNYHNVNLQNMHNIRNGPRARRVVIHGHDWPPLQPHTNQGKAYLYGETHTHTMLESRGSRRWRGSCD